MMYTKAYNSIHDSLCMTQRNASIAQAGEPVCNVARSVIDDDDCASEQLEPIKDSLLGLHGISNPPLVIDTESL